MASSTAALLERARQRRLRQENQTPATPSSPVSSPLDLNSSPNPFGIGSSFNSPVLRASTIHLKSFGDRTLKRIKLTDDSEAEFKRYIETTNIEERNALQFIHTLELKDMLAKSTEVRVENWAPSNKLAKAIRKFIWALLLLPNIQFYSGTVENAVIKSMRDSNVKELPAPGSFDCDTLTKFVAREFSIARYSMKKTITSSVEKDTDTGYIGALAAELLTHATAVNATLGLYFRLAFIRAHTKANHAANEFWTKVDDQLEELHSETPQEFVAALELIYDDDIELYVAPVGSTFKTGDPVGDSSPQWLRNLATAATQVQRFKKQGTKRKRRAQVNDEEGDEPEIREQEEPEENGNGAGGNHSDADPE